jgi:hypothetical protein
MAITELSRAQLNQEFRDGERPSGDDFASAWSSFLHKSDDGVKIDLNGNLELNRGVTVKDAPAGQAGTLRFHSGQLQYHDGANFISVSTGSSGAFLPVTGGPSVAFDGGTGGTGNVGIGVFSSAPTHKLDVILGNNTASNQRVKMGNLVVHNGSTGDAAYISNAVKTGDLDYAVRQNSQGQTTINTSNNTQLVLAQNGSIRFKILVSGAIELNPATSITLNGDTAVGNPGTAKNLTVFGNLTMGTTGAPKLLTVNGNINYTGTLTDTSDKRLKKDVRPYKEGLKKIVALEPVNFKFNGLGGTVDDNRDRIGLIAQDVHKVFPELVHPQLRQLNPGDSSETKILTVDFQSLTFIIINAIKELSARIDKLEKNSINDKRKPKSSIGTNN